ncbi:MAG: type 1 glutamine amidotransferase [Nocardiopsaceae bacterium]|nr:type 1 glutamine amidotransferase [Nocardiopsaceae bacterium]
MRALFIQHDHVSGTGLVGERLLERGYDLTTRLVVPAERFHSPGVEFDFPDPRDWDLVVVLGAVWAVYDRDLVGSWVDPEVDFLRRAHAEGVPTLGICFGAQALATALGGSVEAAPRPEIGWTDVASDDSSLIEPGPWFEWHYDRYHLPAGITAIAHTPLCPQAFHSGRSLGVQFHPELNSVILQRWLDNGGDDKAREHGIEPDDLLETTRLREAESRKRTHRLVDAFLDQVACAQVPPAT